MTFYYLITPAIIMFITSFLHVKVAKRLLPTVSFLVLLPIIYLFMMQKPYNLMGEYLIATKLNTYILLVSSIVAIGVTLALITLDKHVKITHDNYVKFYRFFAVFWIGLIVSILSNNMGLYWIGLELATLSTVYMIKTNISKHSVTEAWNYMIVGTIAISLILFGIILIYSSAKPILGEEAMNFRLLIENIEQIKNKFLFEIGFIIVSIGMFIKMGFFPMSLWLANIERASFYPVAALFSGILESAIIAGFFKFSQIAMKVNYSHVFSFVFLYTFLTLFIVSFLIFRAKDFIRLFSLSGIEHMALIVLFWVSGGYFAALLHFGAHAFLKPALFLSTGVLESQGKYKIAGALRGYKGFKGIVFWYLVGMFLLAIVSLPPSPMFFSEIYGFKAMIDMAKQSHHLILMIVTIVFLLLFLSLVFMKFIQIYQSMKYEGKETKKEVYTSEILAFIIFAIASVVLLLPSSFEYLRAIYG
ncbi:proton-conducting transporter membrane subunit [Sulfurospirillum sp. 1307]|jgi:hydrogenase-4 component F